MPLVLGGRSLSVSPFPINLLYNKLTAAMPVVALDFLGGGMVLLVTRFWTKVPNESG